MKLRSVLSCMKPALLIVLLSPAVFLNPAKAQVCADPANIIYGLTANGAIYPLNVNTAAVGTVVKSSSYSGNSPNKANGLAYNNVNGRFYYFKRNIGTSPSEFVSYDPGTATVSILAASSCDEEVHTGAITADGSGYYTIDIDANLNYYNITNNTWTTITSSFTDQDGNDVSAVIRDQNAGDIAFDGNGNLWIITSNNDYYGVYILSGPMPTTAVSELTVFRRVDPDTPTPSGRSIAGIAFTSTGQIMLATKNQNRLYRLNNNLTTTLIGTFSVNDLGNDLTSCAFPLGVLPVTWLGFSATLNGNKTVGLNWQIAEKNNTGFYVQHSVDGINWRDLNYVPMDSKDEEGKKYAYTHDLPVNGKNYYRVKTFNEMGKESFSTIKSVTLSSGITAVHLYPNPATDQLRISGVSGTGTTYRIRITDMSGKILATRQMNAGEQVLDISQLPTGMFVLLLTAGDGTLTSHKFIKR